MRVGHWGPIVCASLLAVSPSARAQPRRVAPIVVAADPRLQADAVAAGIALRQYLQNDTRCEPADLFAPPAGNARAQRAKEGAAHLAEARNLLDRMSYEAALRKVSEAVAAYEEADLTSAFPDLLDSIALRALVLHSAEGEGRMQDELVRLFKLKPDYQLDPMRASPVYLPVIARARAEVTGAARVALEVRSAPTPAEIFVDGVYRGIGRVAVPDLAPGAHYVTSRALGYELAQERAVVTLGTPAQVSLELTGDDRGLLPIIEQIRTSSSPVGGRGGSALARWAAASEALVIVLERRGERTWALAALDSLDGIELAAADGVLEKPEDLEALAGKVLFSPERPSGRRMFALALGGGGIAAIGTGVAFGPLARRSHEEAKKLTRAFEEKRLSAASPCAEAGQAWSVSFYYGGYAQNPVGTTFYARCVRTDAAP